MLFQKVIYGNIENKVISGNTVNMLLKIIEHTRICNNTNTRSDILMVLGRIIHEVEKSCSIQGPQLHVQRVLSYIPSQYLVIETFFNVIIPTSFQIY